VTKDGKKAEGEFLVSTGIEEGELIAVEEDSFEFYEGAKFVTLKVKVEAGAKIKAMSWSCNGQQVDNGDGKYLFKNKGAYKVLVIKSPTAADVGTCTATAHGMGEVDSETVNIKKKDSPETKIAKMVLTIDDLGVILTPVSPITCKEKASCVIQCKVEISDGSKAKVGNAWFSKVVAESEDGKLTGMFKNGYYRKDLRPRKNAKTPTSYAGEYYCKYTHKGVEYTSADPIVVETDKKDTTVVLTPAVSPVSCKKGQNCVIRCNYDFSDGSKFKAANSKFYKKEADGTLGPAIKAVYKSSSMMKSFGKKTTSDVAGDYICRYTHKGTEYTSLDTIFVTWSGKVKKNKLSQKTKKSVGKKRRG